MAEATTPAETDPHEWADVPAGSALTGGVAFRFCSRCDREEWADGTVRPGDRECAAQAPRQALAQDAAAPTSDAAMLDAIRELVDEATGYSMPYKRSRFMPIDSAFTNALKNALGVLPAQACARPVEAST